MCNDFKNNNQCFEYTDSGLPKVAITLTVNKETIEKNVDPTMTLLQFLHNELKLFGTKEGCGEGECGACSIMMDGKVVNSCLILAAEANNAEILTVEGLAKENELSILQQEFITHDALQCGFCTPGMLMSARALLDRKDHPTEEEIKEAIEGNFCRCTGYLPIINAIRSAAKREREELK
ncbi:(2Fe-2S)-binding protein [Tindallia californiensis]|uniref:Carbon-monoxide dehydrogenase small subunit n=1 Tax=Tindallia californiensis TaxID=159292 RepID=A0A1H3Q5L9_9FIRM|nr:(2Fe-2S)-binding protein [Tindallia californiensis]SDZ07999.1 carbon-monoxide dehydrogenase small subunit [Tindallia californiensis]